MDFERKSVTTETGVTYFYPHRETGCYTSIVSQSNVEDLNSDNNTANEYGNSIYAYMADMVDDSDQGEVLAELYFTALGRERYSMYKTNNNPQVLIEQFRRPDFSAYGIGDINNDGAIDSSDMSYLMGYAYGRVEPENEEMFRRCDINGDGDITRSDLHLLVLYINERI